MPICVVCQSKFDARSDAKYCNNKCRRKAEYLRKPLIKKQCAHCGNAFDSRTKKTKYCSIACANSATKKNDSVTITCENCGSDFVVLYAKRKRRFCNTSCANSGVHNPCYGLVGEDSPLYGRPPWTKGKTAKTDSRLAKLGKKVSKTLKKKFANGEMSNAGENNPMYGKRGEKSPLYGGKLSAEHCEKMSKITTQRWLNGKYDGVNFRSKYKNGWHFSEKLQRKIYYRSSWERSAFEFLDKEVDVLIYEPEPFSIPYEYDRKRRYIPDILITYKDGTRKLVEIKPAYLISAKKNQAKFVAAREYCDSRNILFEVWDENKIRELITEESE